MLILQTLLEKGVTPDVPNFEGKTAMDVALARGDKNVLFVLKNYGAGGQIKAKIEKTQARLRSVGDASNRALQGL